MTQRSHHEHETRRVGELMRRPHPELVAELRRLIGNASLNEAMAAARRGRAVVPQYFASLARPRLAFKLRIWARHRQ
jgi:hypothetical protein